MTLHRTKEYNRNTTPGCRDSRRARTSSAWLVRYADSRPSAGNGITTRRDV